MALGALMFVWLAALAASSLYRAPRWDVEVQWDGKGWRVAQDSDPLRAGDAILAIEGHLLGPHSLAVDNLSVTSRQELFSWLNEKARVAELFEADRLEVTVQRGGQERKLELKLSRDSWSLLRNPALIHWPVALVFFLVGWTTYLRPRAGAQAFWFYLMCLSMSLVYLTNATSLMARPVLDPWVFKLMNILNQVNFVLGPTLLFHFALLLPRKRSQPWYGGLLTLAYLPAAYVILTLSVPAMGVLVPLLFLGSLLAIAQGAWSYRGVIERQQMKWVGVGFLLGVGPWVLINGLPLLLTGQRLMTDTLPGGCLAFIPVFMAVAVHRYRLFDVGTFLEGTLAYVVTIVMLALLELTVLTAAGADLAVSEASLVGLALVLSLYGPLRARMGYSIARLFHRTEPSDEEVLEALRHSVVDNSTPDGVGAGLARTVEKLWAPTELALVEGDGRASGAYLQLDDPPTVCLNYAPEQALRCGPLPQGRQYTSRVLRQLHLLARQSALYYQSATFFLRADAERQQRLEERERLLGDLHDGVGSALTSIRMLSSESRIGELARDALFELQNVLYDSPDYKVSREQFVNELRGYCRRIFEDSEVGLDFLISGQVAGELSRTTALSLFRILKEGITNALKHSGCARIELALQFSETVTLSLGDDGTGICGESMGRGLASMKARAESLGGELSVRSGQGVQLEVRLPL